MQVLQLVTVSFLFAFLGAPRDLFASSADSPLETLPELLEVYARRTPAETATVLLRAWSTLSEAEREAATLLLGEDLAEMGLEPFAAALLERPAGSTRLAALALVARARLDEAPGRLCTRARDVAWNLLADEDAAEAVFRVGRACFRAERYPEARDWLQQVPPASAYSPFARFLSAQSEYALERPARAIATLEPLFEGEAPDSAVAALRDRAAVWVGDLLTEIGLFDDAAAMLAWPDGASAFHLRAERDRAIAESLAIAARPGASDAPSPERIEERFAAEEGALTAAVASEEDRRSRAAELRRSWPPAGLRARRRVWAASGAEAVLESHKSIVRKVLEILWRSSPPGILAALLRHPAGAAPARPAEALDADARWFFAPTGDVAKSLVALALLVDRDGGREGCVGRAADALRNAVAASVVEGGEPISETTLTSLARGCGAAADGDLEARLETALRAAIAAQALEGRREIHRRRTLYREAVAQLSLEAVAAARAARESE